MAESDGGVVELINNPTSPWTSALYDTCILWTTVSIQGANQQPYLALNVCLIWHLHSMDDSFDSRIVDLLHHTSIFIDWAI
jgi:hypothetical protein